MEADAHSDSRAPFIGHADETWESVGKVSPEASKEYWQKVGRWHVTDSEGELEFALEKLLEVGRAHDVIDLLAMERVEESKPMPTEVALRAFELIRADLLKYKDVLGTIRDDMGGVIDRLAADPEINLSRLARIEFYFTPILSILRPPAALGRALASDPAVLIELVSMAYRKEGEEPQDISDDEAGLASGAFRVLDNWRRLPGTANDGSIDAGELKSYIELVRELASSDEVRRLKSVDGVLGKVLSCAPSGEDGVWPCPAVCEVLEGADSETMENSFVIGKRNQRGVVGRSPYAGGELERELERKYADLAARIRTSYPKTASHLDRIAKGYAWDAKREDERADMQQDL